MERAVGEDSGADSMGRVAFASFIGTAIEFYDFYIYGTAAAFAFATVFVPEGIAGSRVAQLLTYAGFAVAFVARPVGGAVFGHFGDRVGRKTMLIFSLLMMGLATFLIGCLPGYASIGVAAPVLLAVLRFVQGFGLGGSGVGWSCWRPSTPPAAGAASTRASRRWGRPRGSWWRTCSS